MAEAIWSAGDATSIAPAEPCASNPKKRTTRFVFISLRSIAEYNTSMTPSLGLIALLCAGGLNAQTVSIAVDAGKKLGPLKPIWSFFGYDEPNYTYMQDGRKLLSELAALRNTARPKSNPGCGKCGTSRMGATGKARLRSITSCMTSRPMP